MPTVLRYLLYNDPTRLTTTQVGADKIVDLAPNYSYGQVVQLENAAAPAASWNQYVVANLVHVKREPDPVQPGKKLVVYQVFLARQHEWHLFNEPEELTSGGSKIE